MDPALFSLNWFLCLFVEYLPVNTYLHIWDAFLFEGSKVHFIESNINLLRRMDSRLSTWLIGNSFFNLFNSQVLFRYALAIFNCFEEKLLRQNDYMSIFNCFRAELQSLFDIKKLTKVISQKKDWSIKGIKWCSFSQNKNILCRLRFKISTLSPFEWLNPRGTIIIKFWRWYYLNY